MFKEKMKTRHLSLDSGKTTLALEQEYWLLIEEMSEEDGYGDWRDWFYCCMLEDKPDDVSLSRHVRLKLAQFLLEDRNNLRYKYVPEYKELGKLAMQFAKFAW